MDLNQILSLYSGLNVGQKGLNNGNADAANSGQEVQWQEVAIELMGQLSALHNAAIVSEANLAGNIIFVNDTFCKIAKYSREELMGQNHRMLKSGHQPDEVFADLWRTISSGKYWQGVIKNKAKDGSYYWVMSTITPVLGSDGKPVKYIGVRFDITKQKEDELQMAANNNQLVQLEEELRQNLEEVSSTNDQLAFTQVELRGQIAAVDNAAIVSEANLEGNITFVNDTFCKIAKYSREELMGQNHRMLKSGHQPDEIFAELWQTISSGRAWSGVIKNKAKDGTYYWVMSTITPVLSTDGKPVKYIGVRFDITQQKEDELTLAENNHQLVQMEEELRQNLEEVSSTNDQLAATQVELRGQIAAVDNAAIVSEANLEGNITFVNDTFCKIAKYSREELMGQNHRMLKSGHQPDEIFTELWQTISAGRAWSGVIKNKAKDGTYYWVMSTITPVLGAEGKPIKYIGVRFDITQQKEYELTLAENNHQLAAQEEELRQNLEELQATQEALQLKSLEMNNQWDALNTSLPILTLTLDGRVTYANSIFLKLMGYELSTLIDQPYARFLVPDEPEVLADYNLLWEELRSGHSVNREFKRKNAKGETVWVLGSYNPMRDRDGNVTQVLKFVVDVTAQKRQQIEIEASQRQLVENNNQLVQLEEELRQNLEEMSSTNDQLAATQVELRGQIAAVDNSAIVSEANLEGNITFVNDTFCKIAKYSREELMGQNHRILKSGHQPDEIFTELWQTISNGKYWQGVIKNKAKDGTFYWVMSTITPVLGSDGKPLKYIGIRYDLTKQKEDELTLAENNNQLVQMEEELRQNLEEVSSTNDQLAATQVELRGQIAAVDNAAIVSEANLEGNITFVNDTFCKIAKYSREELMGQNHRMLKSGHQPDEIFVELWQTISSGKFWQGVIKNKAKDGTFYWVMSTITPVLGVDGKPIKYIGVRYDITEQVEAEAYVRQTNENLEAIVSARTQELAVTLDNVKAMQSQLVQSEKLALLGQLVAGVAHEINTPLGVITGASKDLETTIDQLLNELPVLISSLTDRQREQFFALVNIGKERIPTINSKLEREYKGGVTDYLTALGVENAAGVARKLIKLGVYENLDNYGDLLRLPQLEKYIVQATNIAWVALHLSNIDLSLAKTQKIVFALKNFARQQHSEVAVPVDLVRNVEDVLTIYYNQTKNGVEVYRDYPEQIPTALGYPDELNQVWTNIVHNALQAMQYKGELKVRVWQYGPEELAVRITDNGPGIPENIQGRIFEAFFTTKPLGEGTGMGLDIVKKIIDKHQGRIEVASVPGETSFTVYVPTALVSVEELRA